MSAAGILMELSASIGPRGVSPLKRKELTPLVPAILKRQAVVDIPSSTGMPPDAIKVHLAVKGLLKVPHLPTKGFSSHATCSYTRPNIDLSETESEPPEEDMELARSSPEFERAKSPLSQSAEIRDELEVDEEIMAIYSLRDQYPIQNIGPVVRAIEKQDLRRLVLLKNAATINLSREPNSQQTIDSIKQTLSFIEAYSKSIKEW